LLAQAGFLGDDDAGSEGFQFVDELGAADDVEGAQSEAAGDLDRAASDAGIGGVLHEPVAGGEALEFREHRMGGGRVDGEHRGLGDVDAGREFDDAIGRDVAALAPRAEGDRGHEIADGKSLDAAAEGDHAPDAFVANDGGRLGQFAVGAGDDVAISGIDGGGEHFEAEFAGLQIGEVERVEAEDVGGFSEGVDAGGEGLHGVGELK